MASGSLSLGSAFRVGLPSRPSPAARSRSASRVVVRAEAINPNIKKDEEKVVDFIKVEEIKGKVRFFWPGSKGLRSCSLAI